MKVCSKCGETKSLDDFYPNANGRQGRMPYCKDCDNSRKRPASVSKLARNRAAQRACADLILRHPEEYAELKAARLAEAEKEAAALEEEPATKGHEGPVRLKSGKARAGQTVADRIDVARCPHCIRHHDLGHTCLACGMTPEQVARSRTARALGQEDPFAEFNDGARRARGAT